MEDLQARLAAALAGRYTIEHEIGRGGMAIVYLARDLRNERRVALKVLRPTIAHSLGPERFLREIKVAATLAHPHILPLFDSDVADGLFFYTMPYVEGESLRHRLKRDGRLPVADAVQIARDVADALAYAHSQNIVHRDIKPENILIEAGHPVVSDFGIARAISAANESDMTGSGIVVGTVEYMSPEQASGQELDGGSDIYSLGCVLYEMLTGRTPFGGLTPSGQVPVLSDLRPDISVDLQDATAVALARDRTNRYATAAEFVAALDRLIRGRPADATRRWGIAVAASVAAIALTLWWINRPDNQPALDPTHIAVLYFDDLSPGAKLPHVAQGLTHDLIEALTRVPTLRITSPDGVKVFRSRAVGLDSIARTLRVGTIVTGSVSASQNRLRVVVRLVDPLSGDQIAGQTFERPEGELFALQDTLTAEVSNALRARLGEEVVIRQERAGTRNADAWNLVQRAVQLREEAPLVSGDDLESAVALYLRAESLAVLAERGDRRWTAPVILRGWIAYDLAGLPMRGSPTIGSAGGVTTSDWLRRARAHAERALAVQAGDPAALMLRGSVSYRLWFLERGDSAVAAALLRAAERDLRAATEQPHPQQARAWAALGALLQLQGQAEQAYFAASRAYEADAFLFNAPDIVFRLFHISFQLSRDAEAIRWCDVGRHRFPTEWLFLDCRLALLAFSDAIPPNVPEAWGLVGAAQAAAPVQYRAWVEPRLRMRAAAVIARARHADSADHVIQAARGAAPDDPELLYLEALARIHLGQFDSAVTLLAANLRRAPDARSYLRTDRHLRRLAPHPGFRMLVGEPGS